MNADTHREAVIFLEDTEPGATVTAAEFVEWIGERLTEREAHALLVAALAEVTGECGACKGSGVETIYGEHERCSNCDGEGRVDLPVVAPLEETALIAAE